MFQVPTPNPAQPGSLMPDDPASPAPGSAAMSLTMTFFPSGRVKVSAPFPDEGPMETMDPLTGQPSLQAIGDEEEPTDGEGEALPEDGSQTYATLDEAVRHVVTVASEVGPEARTEEEGLDEGFGVPPHPKKGRDDGPEDY